MGTATVDGTSTTSDRPAAAEVTWLFLSSAWLVVRSRREAERGDD